MVWDWSKTTKRSQHRNRSRTNMMKKIGTTTITSKYEYARTEQGAVKEKMNHFHSSFWFGKRVNAISIKYTMKHSWRSHLSAEVDNVKTSADITKTNQRYEH